MEHEMTQDTYIDVASMSNTLMKFRLEDGMEVAVLVPPQHVEFPHLARNGRKLAVKFNDNWQAAPFGTVTRLCDQKEAEQLEAMPLDHDFSNGATWGVQVNRFNQETQKYEWGWVHPTGMKPYKFSSEAYAERMLRMMYPEADRHQARIAKHERAV